MTKKNNKSSFSDDGKRYNLKDPHMVKKADSFLWNNRMLHHITAHGFSQSQFMQPEPSFYSHAPLKSEKAAMAPEPQYFDHHPGRFFYVKDRTTGEYFSAPFRPTNKELDEFEFSPGLSDIKWLAKKDGICVDLQFALPKGDDVVEMWKVTITNTTEQKKEVALYPYFPVGFPSWMNTEGEYNKEIEGILAYTLTPYRKLDDYFKIKEMNDYTYLVADRQPDAWEASLSAFEGEGGLRSPEGLDKGELSNTEASYETTACIMQFDFLLDAGESTVINFIFGPANNVDDIKGMKKKYLNTDSMAKAVKEFDSFYEQNSGCIQIETPDKTLNDFINHWLPRQIIYHAETLRMVTDPQTRNHIQDVMGMVYVNPEQVKELYNIAIEQQETNGEMPDGILLREDASLKYTNQIPHRDHCVWAAFAIAAYMEETGDFAYLEEELGFMNSDEKASVYEHVCRGIEWLIKDRSERGLSYIGQGDWNDPMNMVGCKGKGESVWLTQAMAYAIRIWLPMCERMGDDKRVEFFTQIRDDAIEVLNRDCWDNEWYARGFTDDGIKFGVSTDDEGQLFLNTQSFGILCGAADEKRMESIMTVVDEKLNTPYGLVLLAPSYSYMNEKIGRLTQKHPSTAENGSVYCHANAFYTHALFENNYGQRAYEILRSLIPGPDEDDLSQREHLPLYMPNYYRGAYNKRVLGKASHLINTGSIPWIYRCFVEGVFGMKGDEFGLNINPQLPKLFDKVSLTRKFRGKNINMNIVQDDSVSSIKLKLNGEDISGTYVETKQLKADNDLVVLVPKR